VGAGLPANGLAAEDSTASNKGTKSTKKELQRTDDSVPAPEFVLAELKNSPDEPAFPSRPSWFNAFPEAAPNR